MKNGPLLHTISGALASIIVTNITHPLDTVRIRYTVQYSTIVYRNYSQLIHKMLMTEGLSSFYRGLVISCVGTVFRGGIGFGVYESVKTDQMKKWTDNVSFPIMQRISIGFFSGICATGISYPFDTVRRRMQVWGVHRQLSANEAHMFGIDINKMEKNAVDNYLKNARTLARYIFVTEGYRGFLKGMSITMIKTPISTAVSLTMNDIVKKMFGVHS